MSQEIPKRHLAEVLENIVAQIPDEQEYFRESLDSTRSSATTAAPEMMHVWWRQAFTHIRDYFGNRSPESWQPWERKVVEIFNPEFKYQ